MGTGVHAHKGTRLLDANAGLGAGAGAGAGLVWSYWPYSCKLFCSGLSQIPCDREQVIDGPVNTEQAAHGPVGGPESEAPRASLQAWRVRTAKVSQRDRVVAPSILVHLTHLTHHASRSSRWEASLHYSTRPSRLRYLVFFPERPPILQHPGLLRAIRFCRSSQQQLPAVLAGAHPTLHTVHQVSSAFPTAWRAAIYASSASP